MAVSRVQKIIYRTTHNRPTLNRALDAFGRGLNHLGIKRWNTGYLRAKAVFNVSPDPEAVQQAMEKLMAYPNYRGFRTVHDNPIGARAQWDGVPIHYLLELEELGIEPGRLGHLFYGIGSSKKGMVESTYRGLVNAARSLHAAGIAINKRADLLLTIWHSKKEGDWKAGLAALETVPRVVDLYQRHNLGRERIEAYLEAAVGLRRWVYPGILLASTAALGDLGFHPDQIASLQSTALRAAEIGRRRVSEVLSEIASSAQTLQACRFTHAEITEYFSGLVSLGIFYFKYAVPLAIVWKAKGKAIPELFTFLSSFTPLLRHREDLLYVAGALATFVKDGFSEEEIYNLYASVEEPLKSEVYYLIFHLTTENHQKIARSEIVKFVQAVASSRLDKKAKLSALKIAQYHDKASRLEDAGGFVRGLEEATDDPQLQVAATDAFAALYHSHEAAAAEEIIFAVLRSESSVKAKSEALEMSGRLTALFGLREAKTVLVSVLEQGWSTPEARRTLAHGLVARTENIPEAFKLAAELKLQNEVAFLLNDPATPDEAAEAILANVNKIVAKSWENILHGRPPEELSRVFRFCASVMAEKAQLVYRKVNAVATHTGKPTITVYILSTAYKLNIERLADQFLERGMSRHEVAVRLNRFRQEVNQRINVLKATGRDPELARLEAKMAVANEWLARGDLIRFTQPVFLKIPSGSPPAEPIKQRLEALAALARANNYDIMFIDHSTVRAPGVTHAGDPIDFHKGRAIARALDIVDPENRQRAWIYKGNGLEDSGIPVLAQDQPNFIALNLYDGKVYESHTGGQKSDWLPVDDHGEFIGLSWDIQGNEQRSDYLVVTQNGNGKYRVLLGSQVFEAEFRQAIRSLRELAPKTRIPQRNILFVCNANHDRSPLAEHLMRRLVAERVESGHEIQISSAGLEVDSWLSVEGPKKDNPLAPSSGSRLLIEQRGLVYHEFRKRQVSREMAAGADIIFVMTKRQKQVLVGRFPDLAEKVRILREYAGYAPEDQDIPTPRVFNYQTRYLFEEALERALEKMAGGNLGSVRKLPKRPFRGSSTSEPLAA